MCCENAFADKEIKDGFLPSNNRTVIHSFAEAYGWDADKYSLWKWSDTYNGETTDYHRQHEYQDSLLRDSYQEMVDYTLSDTVKKTDDTTNETHIITHGNREDTMAFLEKIKVKLGTALQTRSILENSFGGRSVVQAALSQIGTTDSSTYTEYYNSLSSGNSWFTTDQPWCAAFVTWCAGQCGYVDSVISGNVSCGAMLKDLCNMRGYSYYKLHDTVVNDVSGGYTPVPGDIIMYCDSYSFDSTLHVGIVQYCDTVKKEMATVEGNTQAGHAAYGVWERKMSFSEWQSGLSSGSEFFGYIYIVHVPWPVQEANTATIAAQYTYLTSVLKSEYNLSATQANRSAAAILANVNAATGCNADFEYPDSDGNQRYGLGYWDDDAIARMRSWYKSQYSSLTDNQVENKVSEILGQKEGKAANESVQLDFLLYELSNNTQYQDIWNFMQAKTNNSVSISTKCMSYFFTDKEKTSTRENSINSTATNYFKKYSS